MATPLSELLERTAARHSHLCPRQVLGVRMGIAGLHLLGADAPLPKAVGLVIVETDGCFVDGLEVASGATVGHRTLRVMDYGKIAATFVHVRTGHAVRLAVHPESRTRAWAYAEETTDRYTSQLRGYQMMPDSELFKFQDVTLGTSLARLLGKPDARVVCEVCGEEIINEREIRVDGGIFCKSCAGSRYCEVLSEYTGIRMPETLQLN